MPRQSKWLRTKCYLMEDIRTDFLLESELVAAAFATGIIDAASFADDRIFVSNQTGNSVLIAICSLSTGPAFLDLRAVALSLSCFLIGGLIAGQVGGYFGVRKRAWIIGSSAVQTLCVAIATILRRFAHHDRARPSSTGYAIIALLAVAFGGQVALARTVDVPEITTAMVTSAFIDILVDPGLFCMKNRGRNRRLSLLLSLILGSFIGALAYRRAAWVAYLLSTVGKAAVTVAFCFNKSEDCDKANKIQFQYSSENADGYSASSSGRWW